MTIYKILPFVILALVGGFFIYRIVRNGGIKGALFGMPISRTLGEVDAEGTGIIKTKLKVHLLKAETGASMVGIEFVAKSFASYQMLPAKLTIAEVERLVALLQEAIK